MSSQISLDRTRPDLWIATFNNPPINLIDPETIRELGSLVDALETDPEVRVVVFRSADPDFFLAHWDVLADKDVVKAMSPGRTGMHPWLDVLSRLSRAPAVSIAEIRGRARGAGSEFALACDMRFASRERALMSQFEVGIGSIPGGNPMIRLAELCGRGRTLEIILGADDISGADAEQYGYVNRALTDHELSPFVDRIAKRIASFEKYAISGAKKLVDAATLPDDSAFMPALRAFFEASQQKNTRDRVMSLIERGLQKRSDVELRLGEVVGEPLAPRPAATTNSTQLSQQDRRT